LTEYWDKFGIGKEKFLCYTLSKVWGKENNFVSHYLISEASRLVDEESHVLRYWEEELSLKIPRNDLGHRYYTEVQLDIFRTIKELKRQGYQLKEIKQCLEEMDGKPTDCREVSEGKDDVHTDKPDADPEITAGDRSVKLPLVLPPEEHNGIGEINPISDRPEIVQQARIREFKRLMTEIFTDAMENELDRISSEITEEVSSRVIKEMNYLDRERDEREEERFRQLDTVIRSRQLKGKYRAEAAATVVHGKGKQKRWRQ
jgi:DNA-binding transcriptional MerR regulator